MRLPLSLAVLAAAAVVGAAPAAAKCTRLGFSVNDYGKDGPTKDAKELLDKYIAKWAAEHNIKKYTVGKKDVKCELFLNLIVVDEHTCRAEASVCWAEDAGQKPFAVDANAATPAPVAPAKADKPVKPLKPAPKAAIAPGASRIETGTLPPGVKIIAPPPPQVPAVATPSAADQAASAAEKAAAAAERAAAAAAAAEKAAAAASKSVVPAAAAAAPAPAPAPAKE